MRAMTSRNWPPWGGLLAEVMTALLLFALPARPQQQPPASTTSTDQPKAADNSSNDSKTPAKDGHEGGVANDRLFYTLPNYLTVTSGDKLPPLSTSEKFKTEARSQFDKFEYPWYGMLAGISQAENSERQFGQGFAGYGKRYAATFGDGAIENFLVAAALPSMLREDPRYFRSGTGSFAHRAGYAVSRIFITRSDSGRAEFNFSEIVGSATAAGISTYTYHPTADRNLPNAASVWGSQLALDTLTLVVKEFWPDIHRKLHRRSRVEAAAR
jgi:hypothetical protein